MIKLHRHICNWFIISAVVLVMSANTSYATVSVLSKLSTANTFSFSSHHVSLSPIEVSENTFNPETSDKAITNVKVFYNPVAEQIAVSFKLAKLSHVSIRVMDALGNEAMNLLNGELDGGIQSLSFDTNSKLPAGFYFVRVTTGSETVIKRISIR